MTDDIEAQLDQIHQALVRDGIYVDPTLAGQFTDDQLATISSAQAEAEQPVFVVAFPLFDGDAFAGNPADLLTRLHAEHPEPGIYLAAYTRYDQTQVEGRQYDVPGRTNGDLSEYELTSIVSYTEPETLGEGLETTVVLLNKGPEAITKAYEKARKDNPYTETGDDGGGGGPDGDGFDPSGLIVAALVLAVVGALGWTAIKQIGRGRLAGPSTHVLPPSAMARIRQAHDRQLESQAGDELLALGEAIDAIEIGSRHDRSAWQASLDHYDAATMVLERRSSPDVLDVVGALVLTRRGRGALAAAEKGKPYTPKVDCYLNPLHGAAVGSVAVTPDAKGGQRVKAPLCSACRADLKAERTPDILDVEVGGRPQHYFDTAAEPWASTGYGALETDLVRALHRTSSEREIG